MYLNPQYWRIQDFRRGGGGTNPRWEGQDMILLKGHLLDPALDNLLNSSRAS